MGATKAADRRALRAERKRNEILDVARRLFLERDFSSVTMESVASEVLLSRVTLYQYFQTKMDLFGSILERDMDLLVECMRNAGDPAGSATGNLGAICQAYLSFFRERPEYFKKFSFYFLPGRDMDLPLELTINLEGRLRLGIDVMANCIAGGVKSGEFRQIDPRTAALALWSHLMGAAYASVTGYAQRQNMDGEKVSRFGFETFVNGMKATPGDGA